MLLHSTHCDTQFKLNPVTWAQAYIAREQGNMKGLDG